MLYSDLETKSGEPSTMSSLSLAAVIVLAVVLLINVFFGYWRSNTKRLSPQWIMAIHIPVPFSIVLRLLFLGWSWLLLPAFVAAFALGQFIGGQLRKVLKRERVKQTSFLALDVFRVIRSAGKETS